MRTLKPKSTVSDKAPAIPPAPAALEATQPAPTPGQRVWKRREYEKVALVAARRTRVLYLFWTRRGRKSTTLGAMAFDAMSATPGTSVIAASASLLVGAELVNMTVSATEQAIKIRREATAMRDAMQHPAGENSLSLVTANTETGKVYKGLSDEDYADLYSSKKLEFRLYFDQTNYSRMMILAPNPATARGFGGWVFRDEQQFTHPQLERDLQLAMKPIFDTDPTFRLVYASNLCGDDRHPGYEMTLPREPMTFRPDVRGHLYVSQTGITVHRVDLADAYAAGHTLFDTKAGAPLSLAEALAGMSSEERKWNYMLVHESGGTAAVDAVALHTAQQRGVGKCACLQVNSEQDFDQAMVWLREHLRPGVRTGIGYDVATTTSGKSNPSSVTVLQSGGIDHAQVLVVFWKTRDPKLARERLRKISEVCEECQAPARRICIDASSELYFAEETKQELGALIPVECVSNGKRVDPRPSGYETDVDYKTYLGDAYATSINDNRYALPPERYLKDDHRSVYKDRGRYQCDVSAEGAHGDTFDSGKLAQYAVDGSDGAAEAVAAGISGVSASYSRTWRK